MANKAIYKKRWGYIVISIIIMMCLGTVYSWSVFRLPVERQFNIGTTESGYPYMISLACYSLFVLLTGKYIGKYKPSKIMMVGGLLVGIGWITSAFAPNIYILTLSYGMLIGAGVGIVYGVPMNVISRWFPDKKGLATGLVLVGFGLSPLITAPIASYLVGSLGIMKAFFIIGVTFLILVPLLSLLIKYPEETIEQSASNKEELQNEMTTKEMVKTRAFKGLYITFVFGTMIGLMIIGITSNVGVELIKLNEKNVASFMALFAVFNGLGRVSFGVITDKFSNKFAKTLSYSLILSSGIMMLFAKEGSIVIYVIAFCILWFNLGGWLAIAPTTTMKLFGNKNYSKNYGVVFTAYGIGAVLGVIISGMLKEAFNGYTGVFVFIMIISIVGLMVVQLLFSKNKR